MTNGNSFRVIPGRWGGHIGELGRLANQIVLVSAAHEQRLAIGKIKVEFTYVDVVFGGRARVEAIPGGVYQIAGGDKIICWIPAGRILKQAYGGGANAGTHSVRCQIGG